MMSLSRVQIPVCSTPAVRFSKCIQLIHVCYRNIGQTLLAVASVLVLSSWQPLGATEPLTAVDSSASRYAISVGIDIYSHPDLPRLHYATEDARRLSGLLESLGYNTKPLYDFQTDPNNLLARIVSIGEKLDRTVGRENGTLVITYAGHGFQQDNENYLAMGNADPANLSGTSLSMTDLKNTLAESGIGKKILLIDACRSNPARSSVSSENVFIEQAFDASGLSVLFSSSPGEPSYEYSSIGQGVFSYFVAMALKGEPRALDTTGWLTVDSLFEWVKQEINRFNQKYDYSDQFPWRESDNNGDIRIGQPMMLGSTSKLQESVPLVARTEADSDGFSLGKLIAGVAAIVVIGAVIAENSSEEKGDDSPEPSLTLLVPTP